MGHITDKVRRGNTSVFYQTGCGTLKISLLRDGEPVEFRAVHRDLARSQILEARVAPARRSARAIGEPSDSPEMGPPPRDLDHLEQSAQLLDVALA
jgi:hypothetical protein